MLVASTERIVVINDWNLSKEMTDLDPGRAPWRTGTWQFMSHAMLTDDFGKSVHEPCDDLESIFWLLTYYVLHDQPMVVKDLSGAHADFVAVFNEHHKGLDGRTYGGKGKLNYLRQGILDHRKLKKVLHAPVDGLLHDLRLIFCKLYQDPEDHPEDVARAKISLETIDTVRHIFEEQLRRKGWPEDDKAVEILDEKDSKTVAR